jgi:hypothetical protein
VKISRLCRHGKSGRRESSRERERQAANYRLTYDPSCLHNLLQGLQVMHYPQCNLHPPEKVCTDEKCHTEDSNYPPHYFEGKKALFEKKVRWWAGVEIITKGAVRVQSTHINGRCIDCFPFGGGRAMALVRCKHFSSPGREFFPSLPGPCCYSTT